MNSAERSKKVQELNNRTFVIFGIVLLACMLVALWMGMEYQHQVDTFYNQSGKPDFSFWSRNNAMSFCKAHGFSGAWMECGIDAGFTCSDSVGEFLRTKCFSIQDLYEWQYQR